MRPIIVIAFLLILLIAMLLSGCTTAQKGEPVNIQVRVVEVLDRSAGKIRLKCVSTNNDTVYVNYGWHSVSGRTLIKVGTKLTIHGYRNDSTCVWYSRKIKINH